MTKISISSLNLEDGCERAQIIYKRKKNKTKTYFLLLMKKISWNNFFTKYKIWKMTKLPTPLPQTALLFLSLTGYLI